MYNNRAHKQQRRNHFSFEPNSINCTKKQKYYKQYNKQNINR